jgi:thioredoxin-related protein
MRVGVVLLLALLAGVCLGEEWFMPDSRLISDEEWRINVKEKDGFKMVKYFTPHCPYCRYLKAAVDKLKHEKQWCFEIYDLNCQWYPQFCMQEVHSTSFPYTVIYDNQGNLNEEIHGFYPEPVLRTIFDRV